MRVLAVLLIACFTAVAMAGCTLGHEPNAAELKDMAGLATEFIQRRTSALIGTDSSISSVPLCLGSVRESNSLLMLESGVLTELNSRRDQLRNVGEIYNNHSTRLILRSTLVEKDTVVLNFDEETRLYYANPAGGQPQYTAWTAPRKFVFERVGTSWELVSQEYFGGNPVPLNEPMS